MNPHADEGASAPAGSLRNKIAWGLQGLAAVGFLFPLGAVPKLTGDPYSKDLFRQVTANLGAGLADPARYAVGLTELAVAVLILIPATRVYGAMLGVLAMLGAIGSHVATPLGVMPTLTSVDGETAQPPLFFLAIALLLVSAAVVWLRRDELPVGGGRGVPRRGAANA